MSDADWSGLTREELERRHREACGLLLAAEAELARLAGAYADADRRAELTSVDLAASRERVLQLEARLTLVEGALADVVGSASWQVTRPLRELKARVRDGGA